MSDILAKLKAGRAVIKPFTLDDAALGLRLLTEVDYQAAGWAANALLDAHEAELSPANAELFESEKATHLLQRFTVDPATGKSVFPGVEDVRELSRDQRNALGAAYYEFEKEFSPSERTLSEAEFSALLEDVKKKPDLTALSDLSGEVLKRLVLSLAAPPTT